MIRSSILRFNRFLEFGLGSWWGLTLTPFLLLFVLLLPGQFLGSFLPAVPVSGHSLYLHGYRILGGLPETIPGIPLIQSIRAKLS